MRTIVNGMMCYVRYDYDGDIDDNIIINFVSEYKDGFTINFGKITGDFNCYGLGLKSLKGAPTEVGGSFDCHWNKLVSLEGVPKKVDSSFDCSNNQLTSLRGAPQKVSGWFDCYNNKLTSLKGAPQEVGGDFDCYNNPNLHSLDGIGEVKGVIYN